MRTVSETFAALHNAEADCEIRLNIGGTIYTKEEIFEARLSSSAIPDDKPSVGNAIASQLQFGIEPKSTIPRMAEIKLELRLTDGVTTSEWLPFGTYYIDTRETTADGDYTEITAYDSMLKAEQSFTSAGEQGEWPRTDIAVVTEIASRIGVELDERTTKAIVRGYQIEYPGIVLEDGTPQYSKDGAMTCREILGHIGVMYGGNFIITPENKLRLVPLAMHGVEYGYLHSATPSRLRDKNGVLLKVPSESVQQYHGNYIELNDVGRDMTGYTDLGTLKPITGVTLQYTDENEYVAGDDTGYMLVAYCPWATQEITNAVYELLKGYVYNGFEAEKVNITPAFELGDVVKANGIVAPINNFSVVFDGAFYPDIGTPADNEVDHEYPYTPATNRAEKKADAELRASLIVTRGSITSEVTRATEAEGQLSTRITQTANSITSEVERAQNAEQGISESVSRVSQTADNIKAQVTDGSGNYTVLNLKSDGLHIGSASGTTTIDGKNITAGSITADRIKANELVVGTNVLMGENATIAWEKVNSKPTFSTVATSGNYNDLSNKPSIPYVPSYITYSKITSTTIESPTITGNDIEAYNTFIIMNSDDTVRGYMGHGTGAGDDGTVTEGVVMTCGDSSVVWTTDNPYVIVTPNGARVSGFGSDIYVYSGGPVMRNGTVALEIRSDNHLYFAGTQIA